MSAKRSTPIARIMIASWLLFMAVDSVHAGTAVVPVPFKKDAERAMGRRTCTGNERWDLSAAIPEGAREEFENFINKKLPPVRAFSEALNLRRVAQTLEVKAFAEYWIARSLYDAKLIHVATEAFGSIASRALSEETFGTQIAALECIVEINRQHPTIGVPAPVAERLSDYPTLTTTNATKDVLWRAATLQLRNQLSAGGEKASSKAVVPTLLLLKDSGAYELFAHGLWAAKQVHHAQTISELEKFLSSPSIPEALKGFTDTANILLARAYYTVGQYEKAGVYLKRVKKSSNDLADTLSELSWSYLMAEKYSEAIGSAMSLQAGGLRHTFAPEAPMVMAMAMNELCQYPDSVRAINTFRRIYERPFYWLSKNSHENLYPTAVAFLKKKEKLDVPERIASEWVRSPVFISNQDELNLLIDEKDSTVGMGKSGASEQKKLFARIIKTAKELKPKYKMAMMKRKEGDTLPKKILEDLASLRDQVAHFRRLQKGAPVWKLVMKNYASKVPGIREKLVAGINKDLGTRSTRMLRQLEEIAENVQLIEVEIYHGASQDIIWQNAHPDYKAVAQKMKDDYQKTANEKVWNWGKLNTNLEEDTEIWEDELGSFRADLFDNCSSKDRYLAIKKVKLERRE